MDSFDEQYKNYDYRNPSFALNTGLFTQMVWVDTKLIGIGFGYGQATNGYTPYYCVANYYPPGNVVGQYDKNVLRPY